MSERRIANLEAQVDGLEIKVKYIREAVLALTAMLATRHAREEDLPAMEALCAICDLVDKPGPQSSSECRGAITRYVKTHEDGPGLTTWLPGGIVKGSTDDRN